MRRIYALIVCTVALMSFLGYVFGRSDFLTLTLTLFTTYVIYSVIIKLQAGNRKTLRVNAREGGWWYRFLSEDKTMLMRFISVIIAIIMACSLAFTLNGLAMDYGGWKFYFIVSLVSLMLVPMINLNNHVDVIEENIHADIMQHAIDVGRIFMVALLLNVSMSAILSFDDTNRVIENDVTIANIVDSASEHSFEKTPENEITRRFANIYILTDTFKLALVNEITGMFLGDDKESYYIWIYLIVWLFNLFKMFAFSFAFVFIQKGFDNMGVMIEPYRRSLVRIWNNYHSERGES